jgi:hypothetical protein
MIESAVLIDRDHEELQAKLAHKKFATDLQKPHGEDVATWNLFRALTRLDAEGWVPALFSATSLHPTVSSYGGSQPRFWRSLSPTDARLSWLRQNVGAFGVQPHDSETAAMEGRTQVDVLIEHPEFNVVIEAKRGSDIEESTTYQRGYDQIARQLDVAEELEASSKRPTFVWFLAVSPTKQPKGFGRCEAYRDPAEILRVCRHFTAEQAARRSGRLGVLRWRDATAILRGCDLKEVTQVHDWLVASGVG